MADVNVVPERPGQVGLAITAFAVTAADTGLIPNDGRTKLLFTSTPGATVTVDTPEKVGDLDVEQRTYIVPAAGVIFSAGPFPQQTYGAVLSLTTTATIAVYAERI